MFQGRATCFHSFKSVIYELCIHVYSFFYRFLYSMFNLFFALLSQPQHYAFVNESVVTFVSQVYFHTEQKKSFHLDDNGMETERKYD